MDSGSAGVSPARSHDGWRSRGYLPHFDCPGLIQMITFRLADALPSVALAALGRVQNSQEQGQRRRVEAYLDAGYGACHLQDVRLARLVLTALLRFDGTRYHLVAWVVMPNHVHVLVETLPGQALSDIVHAWKSFTAKEANKLLGRTGRFWQPDYFDRAIRDERHLASAVTYVHDNPVKAGLVRRVEDWPFSSAVGDGQLWEAGERPALPSPYPRTRTCAPSTSGAGRSTTSFT